MRYRFFSPRHRVGRRSWRAKQVTSLQLGRKRPDRGVVAASSVESSSRTSSIRRGSFARSASRTLPSCRRKNNRSQRPRGTRPRRPSARDASFGPTSPQTVGTESSPSAVRADHRWRCSPSELTPCDRNAGETGQSRDQAPTLRASPRHRSRRRRLPCRVGMAAGASLSLIPGVLPPWIYNCRRRAVRAAIR